MTTGQATDPAAGQEAEPPAGGSAQRRARRSEAAPSDRLPLPRDSISWRVNGDPAPFLGASAALLLQVAHPLVAAGVAEHSDYQSDPWSRLYRTLDTTLKMTFGAPEKVRRMERRLESRHRPVVGVARDGRRYDARDPELGRWVWATLVDTGLLAYQATYGPLPAAERERFYQESKLFAEASGVPRARCPQTWEDFEAYYARVIHEELERTPECLDVARSTFRVPQLPSALGRLVGYWGQFTAAGFMPERVREIYGLNWSEQRERRFRRFLCAYGAVLRRIPRPLRELPVVLVVDHDVLETIERRRRRRYAEGRNRAGTR